MNTGALKYVIEIYGKPRAQDAEGYVNRETTMHFSGVRAKRMDAGNREVWEAYAAQVQNVVNWKIRHLDDIEVGMEIRHGGQRYEIIAVQHLDGAPRYMTLKTSMKEAE